MHAQFDVLRAYLEARGVFTADELDVIRSVFVPGTLLAGEFLTPT